MRAKKSLGQNFLMHHATAERIADAAQVSIDDTVLEIGPGTGMLTRALLSRAGKVIAVEADAALLPGLHDVFEKELSVRRLELIHGDIREFDSLSLPQGFTLVANIPYYLTGEIIRQFLSGPQKPSSMTLLVQREVAQRIARSQKESLLSLSVKVYGTPTYEFTVPRGSFIPKPNVDSAVLSIRNIKNPFVRSEDETHFFEILHAGFAHKRKLLSGNLSVMKDPALVRRAMEEAHIPLSARAEDVPLEKWLTLAHSLLP